MYFAINKLAVDMKLEKSHTTLDQSTIEKTIFIIRKMRCE